MPLRIVRDIMLPLEEYAVVDEEATMVDALEALEAAQAKVPAGRHPHRAVLVRGADGAITGKLGHLAFFAGLEPSYLADLPAMSRVGLSKDLVRSIQEMGVWQLDFNDYVLRAQKTCVKDVMHSVAQEHIDAGEPIGEAIHKLVVHQTLSLVVTEGGRAVGILRLADLFPVVAKLIVERSVR